jgi:hypothetical protein
MPSTFSPNLRIELIGNGEQAGNWGSTTNTNLGTLVEDAISGYATVSVTTANQAFTYADGADDQARNAMIELTTTTGAAFAVYAPPSPKLYVIYNASSYTATIYNSTVVGNTTAAGTGVAVPAGRRLFVMSDGTDFSLVTAPASSSNVANTLVERDGSGNFAAGTITADLVGDVTGDVSGTALNITGIAAVANGGTGASTADGARTNLKTGTVPPVVSGGAYTLQLSDVGDHVSATGNITVPPAVFAAGDVVVIYNNTAGNLSILRGSGVTMYWVAGADATRILGTRGLASVVCVASNTFVITGQGLT